MRQLTDTDQVIIVGAGPVGLCTGLLLALRGVPFVIFENDGGLSTEPKAGTMLPSSLEIFSQLGIIDDFLADGLRCGTVDFLDRRSKRIITRMQVHELATETRNPILLNIAQSETERILYSALCAGGFEDRIRFNHTVTEVRQDDAGVRVTVEDGSGKARHYTGSYALGCDGARSVVREAMGVEFTGRTHPELFALFNVAFDTPAADAVRAPATAVFDPDEWMILVRLKEFWRVVWPQPAGREEPNEDDLRERLRFAFGTDHPFEIVGRATYRVHHRYAEHFCNGRFFVLGDAAHLMTPIGGLGMNTGLQDAGNLSWKLAMVLKGQADPSLLDTYERERLPIARFVAGNLADGNRAALMMRNPIKRIIRNTVMWLQAHSEPHRWQAAYLRSMLGMGYAPPAAHGSPLQRIVKVLRPEARPAVRPGDYSPDGPVRFTDGRTMHLHDLLSSKFLAVTFADARDLESLPVVVDPRIDHYIVSAVDVAPEMKNRARTLVDLGSRLTKRYHAEEGSTYLIRPDGYVLDVFSSAHGPQRYSARIADYQSAGKPRVAAGA